MGSNAKQAYYDFAQRLQLFISKQPTIMSLVLSNIFTMRLVGNKTHGDLAEVAISEFVNQYMYDFRSRHVGKELFRAKSSEEDISVTNEITGEEFPISLKAYGDGPLQLSTDKSNSMFARLENEEENIIGHTRVAQVLEDSAFAKFSDINVLPLIYDESAKQCNILIFDYEKAKNATARIVREDPGGRRKHPVYKFQDGQGGYICEVRYGGAGANALQRGLWTNTKRGVKYFDSITNGWIAYTHNLTLLQLLSHALVCSVAGHENALGPLKDDISTLRTRAGIVS
ncbi:hypothetical protein [Candidatus Poriferisodalis sp.]|uniref:hypothetical protein n=1 Tax=Candidatus Poriferisodalis sp. TaxID=3101277 RepID=UPI003AF5A11E